MLRAGCEATRSVLGRVRCFCIIVRCSTVKHRQYSSSRNGGVCLVRGEMQDDIDQPFGENVHQNARDERLRVEVVPAFNKPPHSEKLHIWRFGVW